MNEFFAANWLDITGSIIGLVYIYQEYKASIWLWITGIIMPVVYMFVYIDAGLYADFGMQVYYTLAAIWGFIMWKWGSHINGLLGRKTKNEDKEIPISHFPKNKILQTTIVFLILWGLIYWILIHFTDSTVPILDSWGNALSVIGLWALARKYIEQWWIWIAVDIELSALYFYKGLTFTAILYALYVAIAVAGYFKWKKMITV